MTNPICVHAGSHLSCCAGELDAIRAAHAELKRLAVNVATAYEVWVDAEGWDNPEYDALVAAVYRLTVHLGLETELANPALKEQERLRDYLSRHAEPGPDQPTIREAK